VNDNERNIRRGNAYRRFLSKSFGECMHIDLHILCWHVDAIFNAKISRKMETKAFLVTDG